MPWTESLLSMSSPEGHSLAVRYRVPVARKKSVQNMAKRQTMEELRKACNFPILSLSFSFHILHFFSFVFDLGGFLSFVLVYLTCFILGSKRLQKRRTHANGE